MDNILTNICNKKIAGKYSNLTINDFIKLELLGQGSFGKVYKAKLKQNNIVYALKIISKTKIIESGLENQINNEIKVMEDLEHSNIIELFNYFEDNFSIYLVLEYAPNVKLIGKFISKIK